MKTVALFPGSFDPFTAGHLNILSRALTMFDEIVVAVGVNQDKRGFFDMDKRVAIIEEATGHSRRKRHPVLRPHDRCLPPARHPPHRTRRTQHD